jgi:hypothetical protein
VTLSTSPQAFSISASPRPVRSTVAGTRYTSTAWVRSATPGRTLCLRLREWVSGGSSIAQAQMTCVTSTSAWQKIAQVALTTTTNGGSIAVEIYEAGAQAGDSFEVDGVSLTTP